MPGSTALFTDAGSTYAPDNCDPLVDAAEAGRIDLNALARTHYPGIPLPERVLPGVLSVGCWDAEQKQAWGLDWHRNEGLELTFLETGRVGFHTRQESRLLEPGTLTLTRPWQPHRVGNPEVEASRLHWLILDVGVRRPNQDWSWPDWLILTPDDLSRLTTLLRHNEQPVWRTGSDMATCWQKIAQLIAERPLGFSRLTVLLNELFILLLETLERHPRELDESLASSLRTVKLFIEELEVNNEQRAYPWTTALMAERCGVGTTQFTRLCRQLTNASPNRFLVRCRIEAAKQRLLEPESGSIVDIAHDCGFNTSQYFATVFKKETGRSPHEFRMGP